jgi:hypothetical protein
MTYGLDDANFETACLNDDARNAVRLWDGRDYDRAWLAGEYPELLSYAEEHTTLRETCPVEARAVAEKMLATGVLTLNGLFGALFIWGGWMQARWLGAVVAFATINGLLLPVCLLYAWATYSGFRRKRPTVAARAGHIWIYQGKTWTHV